MIKELIEMNRYLHDFTSALWVCGSILLWMLRRELMRTELSSETRTVLARLVGKLFPITLTALAVTLASGGIRALTFAEYEHVGAITTLTIVTLVVKHVAFTAFVAWGLWIHWQLRAGRGLVPVDSA